MFKNKVHQLRRDHLLRGLVMQLVLFETLCQLPFLQLGHHPPLLRASLRFLPPWRPHHSIIQELEQITHLIYLIVPLLLLQIDRMVQQAL